MPLRFIMLLFTIWVLGMVLGSTIEFQTGSAWVGVDKQNQVAFLMNFSNVTQQQEFLGGAVSFPLPNTEYFAALFDVMTLNFSFLNIDNTGAMMFKWIVLGPLTIGGVVVAGVFGYSMLRGNLSF